MARPAKFDLERALALDARGVKHADIGKELGVSQQYVSKKLREVKAEQEQLPPWPWKIDPKHIKTPDRLYRMMAAYRRQRAGSRLEPADVTAVEQLRAWAHRLNAAITYDQDKGFMWTSRRDEDGDEMFVVR